MGDSNKSSGESNPMLHGTPLERINSWLKPAKNAEGHIIAGDWMAALVPYLAVESISSTGSHPSVTFTYAVQPEHCNRLQNLHGGAAATLFDFCTTMPLVLVNRPGFWQYLGVTRTLNVTYMRPVPSGEEVLIECHLVQVGKKLCALRGVMKRKRDGQLLCMCDHGKVNIDPEANL